MGMSLPSALFPDRRLLCARRQRSMFALAR